MAGQSGLLCAWRGKPDIGGHTTDIYHNVYTLFSQDLCMYVRIYLFNGMTTQTPGTPGETSPRTARCFINPKLASLASSRNMPSSEVFFFLPWKRSKTKNILRSTVLDSQAPRQQRENSEEWGHAAPKSLGLINPVAVCGSIGPQACGFSLRLRSEFIWSMAGCASCELPESNLLEQKPHQKAGHMRAPRSSNPTSEHFGECRSPET